MCFGIWYLGSNKILSKWEHLLLFCSYQLGRKNDVSDCNKYR